MRTYTLTRVRKTARNETWCSLCRKGHRKGSKLERAHAAHRVGRLGNIGAGNFEITFKPGQDVYRGVPEILATRATETGEYQARLEEES